MRSRVEARKPGFGLRATIRWCALAPVCAKAPPRKG
jgi:hypothetical protein